MLMKNTIIKHRLVMLLWAILTIASIVLIFDSRRTYKIESYHIGEETSSCACGDGCITAFPLELELLTENNKSVKYTKYFCTRTEARRYAERGVLKLSNYGLVLHNKFLNVLVWIFKILIILINKIMLIVWVQNRFIDDDSYDRGAIGAHFFIIGDYDIYSQYIETSVNYPYFFKTRSITGYLSFLPINVKTLSEMIKNIKDNIKAIESKLNDKKSSIRPHDIKIIENILELTNKNNIFVTKVRGSIAFYNFFNITEFNEFYELHKSAELLYHDLLPGLQKQQDLNKKLKITSNYNEN